MPKIIIKVDSNIRRYRARFCKRSRSRLTDPLSDTHAPRRTVDKRLLRAVKIVSANPIESLKQKKDPTMSAKEPTTTKPVRTPDSAYSFSFAIAIGLILFLGGLVISLTLGGGSSIGLIFGIPLLLAGLIVPLIMMRQFFKQNEVSGVCPYCSEPIRTSDATIRLQCPNCHGVVVVRDGNLFALEG
jgi:predicted RNA-binding Zn-ribbon protein involved in translation (DUF1610 family)